MKPLLAQLRMEHVGLSALLRQAMAIGPDTTDGARILGEAKALLLTHLKTEQDELFATLREAAQTDAELRAMLASPAAEQSLRQGTLLFTRLDLACSKAELADALEGLRARFLWEETKLFPAYEMLASGR